MEIPAALRRSLLRWPPRPPVLLFSLSFLVLLIWWIAFYPGLVSPDSVTYTLQVTYGPWSADFSVFYNALLWLSFKITGGIALLTFAQMVATAAVMSYAGMGVHRLGARLRWVFVAVVGACATPVLGSFSTYVSKDVAFALAEVFAMGVIARLVVDRQRGVTAGWRRWAALAVAFLLMCLFRVNGWPMIVVATCLLLIGMWPFWRRILVTSGAALVAWAIAAYGIYPAAGVLPASASLVLGTAYADIASAYQHSPSSFSPSDLSLMSLEAPLRHWKEANNCYTSDQLDVGQEWDRMAAQENHTALFHLWLRVLSRTPNLVLDARICRGAIAWMPFPPQSKATSLLPGKPPPNLFGHQYDLPPGVVHALRLDPPIAPLQRAALWAERASFAKNLQFLLYRGATWAYVGYLAVFLCLRRRRQRLRGGLALVSVIVANQVLVFADNPNQLARYMLGPLLMGVLLATLFSARRVAPAEGSAASADAGPGQPLITK